MTTRTNRPLLLDVVAGGGIKPSINVVENPVHIHDFNATLSTTPARFPLSRGGITG